VCWLDVGVGSGGKRVESICKEVPAGTRSRDPTCCKLSRFDLSPHAIVPYAALIKPSASYCVSFAILSLWITGWVLLQGRREREREKSPLCSPVHTRVEQRHQFDASFVSSITAQHVSRPPTRRPRSAGSLLPAHLCCRACCAGPCSDGLCSCECFEISNLEYRLTRIWCASRSKYSSLLSTECST
jgi:hypothetical protein